MSQDDLLVDIVRHANPKDPETLNSNRPLKYGPLPAPWSHSEVELFERQFIEHDGGDALAVSSGTAALHLALMGMHIERGDFVVVPAMTFAGCAAAVSYLSAIPLFMDCMREPFGALNHFKLHQHLANLPDETRKKVKAIIAVDLLGCQGITGELMSVARTFGIPVIEDAAGALGSTYVGKYKPDVITYSFNNNKIITTYGGGVITSDNRELIARCRHLATTAKTSALYYEHDRIGYNYRMPLICAQIGNQNMNRLERILALKHELRLAYCRETLGTRYQMITPTLGDGMPNHWLNAVMIEGGAEVRGDALLALRQRNIACRPLFTPLHQLEPYRSCPTLGNLAMAESLFTSTIILPSGVDA